MKMPLPYDKTRMQVEMHERNCGGSLESTVSLCIAGSRSVPVSSRGVEAGAAGGCQVAPPAGLAKRLCSMW